MKRRDLLKRIIIGAGAAVAVPLSLTTVVAETKPLTVSNNFERMSKRKLTVVVKDKIRDIAHSYIFEPNDDLTRNALRANIEHYLNHVVASENWLADYRVVCDETNNTPKRIQNGNLYGDVILKFHGELFGYIYVPFVVKVG